MIQYLRCAVRIGFVIACAAGVLAQTPDRPVFEAASIKPNMSGPTSMQWAFQGRRFTARYVTLKALISTARGVVERPLADYQISGGPRWLESDRFDVVATAPGIPDSPRGTFPAPVLAMLRGLLEERFRLQTHYETKELPLLALVLARRDGTLGPHMRRRTVDCVTAQAAAREARNLFDPTPPDHRACGGRVGPGNLIATGATMTNIASGLARLVPGINRIVVDRTGLTGTFDVDLSWNVETTADNQGVSLPPPDTNAPSLFTALQEQLGLRLESTRGPVDILVIDHAEPPTPD